MQRCPPRGRRGPHGVRTAGRGGRGYVATVRFGTLFLTLEIATLNRSEPFALTELVNTKHINDVWSGQRRMPEDAAMSEAGNASVVLALRISEPQGDGVLLWHRGEELPSLLYFQT